MMRIDEILTEEQLQKIKDVVRPFVPRFIINERGRRRMMRRLKELAETRRREEKKERPLGINLYGDRLAGTGLSMSVCTLLEEFAAAGIPYSFHQVDENAGKDAEDTMEQTDYAVNLFHLQPPVWAYYALHMDRESADTHYNIAHWAWETPMLPEEWIPACDYFDEIWTPSAFVAKAVKRACPTKIVRVMPHGICSVSQTAAMTATEMNADTSKEDRSEKGMTQDYRNGRTVTRLRYGIPSSAFTAILLYDGRSSTERKNPFAGIRAYISAFPKETDGACLIVKGKHFGRSERKKMEALTGTRKDIRYVDGELSYEDTQALIAAADVLISLHRAEGFGLPVAEAMRAGVVPVATDYSATREIMDADCGMPVNYRLMKTGRTYGVYRRGTIWADPDIEDAAIKLRTLKEDRALLERLAQNAKTRVERQLSAKRIGERIRNVLEKTAEK